MPETNLKVRHRIYLMQIGAYLLITVVAIAGFWKMGDQQGDLEHSQDCTTTYLGAAVQALNSRTTLSAEANNANRAQNVAWRTYIRWALETPPKEQKRSEAKKLVQDYYKKLDAYIHATHRINQAALQPFPTEEAYRDCLNR